ncbi:MAG TPA: RodZ domain-containing protein [Spirochaetia bacterium]|nr:RodZ domain-containing protein [Spirochaetia bacterium]
MESIGDKLKSTRESRGYTLEQVARDTHIAKRFLTALEGEDFSLFPGEPYVLGFLRNYAEYLGLSAQEIVGLYKNLKLQEQPAPMNELLERKTVSTPLIAGIIIVVLAAAGLGLVLVLGNKGGSAARPAAAAAVSTARTAAEPLPPGGQLYRFPGGMQERSFKRGDAINVQLKGKDYRLILTGIGKTVTLSTPAGSVDLSPDQEKVVDLSADGKADIKLFVRSISTLEGVPVAVLRLDSAVNGASSPTVGTGNASDATAAAPAAGAAQAAGTPEAAGTQQAAGTTAQTATPAPQAQPAGTVIETMDQQQPFAVNVTFTAPALFRYSVDNGQRQERYYDAGETFTTTASSRFELWLSNAGSANLTVAGNPVALGPAGEVATDAIQWNQSNGSYNLLLVPIN